MGVTIRTAGPDDAAMIAEFNRRLSWETEQKRLDPVILGRGVARVLADPGRGFYLVAESGGEVVGQLMATFEWSDWRDGWFWWVQSVYVREEHRRNGVFRALFRELMARAHVTGDVVGVRLYVEKDNTRAQATYERLGLTDAGYLVRERLLDQDDVT
jgi:ribosomal protein S18 acetylase RimI-like enzyme